MQLRYVICACSCRHKSHTVNARDSCATSLCTVTAHVHVHARRTLCTYTSVHAARLSNA
jgi:hypothetical protein